MDTAQSILFWTTTLTLAAAFFVSALALTFKKSAATSWSTNLTLVALATLTFFGVLRWVQTGHPPFVSQYESMINAVWFVLLIFQLLRSRLRVLPVVLPLSLITFLLMGWASTRPTGASPLSSTLDNTWLFIHASFATAGAASFLIAASFSAVFLLGQRRYENMDKFTAKLPVFNSLPRSILNFLLFGLILWGVMIVSGAIWAHSAWGRYWAWDPIELWSLISWLLYALVLHARMGWKLSQRTFCWMTIVAALTVVFSLWGIGYIYETIHEYG
jgi:ABC-type transport system involved in cytochrome c biogenesis permease subunit